MRKVFLAEVTAYDPVNDKMVELWMCSPGHAHIAFDDLPDAEFIPCITEPPVQTVSLNEDGIPGEIQISYGNLGITFSKQLRNTHWRRYDFDGYPCRLLHGDPRAHYSSFELAPGSRLGSLDSPSFDKGSFAIRGPEADLTRDILTVAYGGTGGADGREELKGTLKPFAVGRFENWEVAPLDPVHLVYQFHGYGPAGDVTAVYENALSLGPARITVSTYEELIALTDEQLPPGSWAKAPAVGMFRLGAEPFGKLTFDGIGAIDGASTPTSLGAIAALMLRRLAGVPSDKIDDASFRSFDLDFPHTWGNCVDAQSRPDDAEDDTIVLSVGDFLREALSHAAGYMIATPDGVWHLGRNVSTKEPIVLRQGRSATPVVIDVSSPATSTRLQRIRVGGRRCFSVHNNNEVSSALKEAVNEAVRGGIEAGEKADEAIEKVEQTRKQMPDLVTKLLVKPIDDLSALNLKYGSSMGQAAKALSDRNLIAIRKLSTRVDEDGSKVAEELLQLTSRVDQAELDLAGIDIDGAVEAGLVEIRRTIAGLDFASAEEVDIKIANYGTGVTAWQNEEQRVRAERDNLLAEDIDELGGRITTEIEGERTTREGAINDLRQLIIDGQDNTALAVRIDELGVRITTEVGDERTAREAAIRTVEQGYADADRAAAGRIDTLSASVEGLVGPTGSIAVINGIIQTIQQTEADNNGARAREITTLQSQLDGFNIASVEERLETYATKVDGLGAQYTLKLQVQQDGQLVVAGGGIAIENGVSSIAWLADSFRIMTPGATPKQVFYADANGLLAPELTVGRLTYGALVDQFAGTRNNLDPNGGWQDIPGGLIVMWGRYRGLISRESSFSIIFPKAFPNQCFMAIPIGYIGAPSSFRDLWVQNVGLPSTGGATFFAQAATSDNRNIDGIDWIAFGN